MIERHPVSHASSPIVTDQREGRKAEFRHHVNQLLRHCALGIRKVVVCRREYAASAVSAQVRADYGVIPSKLRRKKAPHQACPRKAVKHENRRTLSVTAIKHLVAGNVDLTGTILRVRKPHE
jgi:hypothetical protein